MTRGFFITGTDTDIGKTKVSLGLLSAINAIDHSTVAMKPVASGCVHTSEGLRSDDAIQLSELASIKLPYEKINPYAFEPPIAPHIAADQVGTKIDTSTITKYFQEISHLADYIIVEGVGGWQVPLNENETLADLAEILGLPVILVVGMRLGCLNHALLSWESIHRRNIRLAGWVANQIQPNFPNLDENVATLERYIQAPLLGLIPYLPAPNPSSIASFLNLQMLVRNAG